MIVLGHYNYWVFIFLMMVGFYILISEGNLIKKIVGLNVFQTSVFFFYISMGKIFGGTAPILFGEMSHGGEVEHAAEAASHTLEATADVVYSNPLPHVLILTAIVVGIATTAVALALVVRIHEAYGTIEEDEIHELDMAGEF
jgi:multicomponent Na+:H+ antiporter subunit C